jgi:hypothetical protein
MIQKKRFKIKEGEKEDDSVGKSVIKEWKVVMYSGNSHSGKQ